MKRRRRASAVQSSGELQAIVSLADRVGALLAERDHLAARLQTIEQTLATIRAALTPAPATALAEVVARQTGKAVPTLAHPNRDEARTDAILAMLDAQPLSVREVAARLNQDRLVVKQALQRLKKSGVLTVTGIGPGTKYTRATPTSAARLPPAESRSIAAERSGRPVDELTVKARDAAVFRALKTAGRAGLSFTELLPVLPDAALAESERPDALTNVLRRLRAKANGVEFGEDSRWRIVS